MHCVRLVAMLFVLWFGCSSNAHDAIVLHYTLRPPYTVAGTDMLSLGGIAGERVTTVLRRAGIPFTLRLSPSLRQLDTLRSNKNRDCTFDWYKTAERQSFAQFSAPFAQDSPYVYVVHRERVVTAPVSMAQILKSNLVLGRIEGYSYGTEIDAYIHDGKIRSVTSHGSELELLTMIRRKRSDFGLLIADEARQLLQHNELLRAELRVYPTSEMPPPSYTYFLCSLMVDSATMNAFNKALQELPFVQYQ